MVRDSHQADPEPPEVDKGRAPWRAYASPMASGYRRSAATARDGAAVGASLQERYGIEVAAVVELDAGVVRVDRHDGPSWVARVFPARREFADVKAEAELLEALEASGFPAERCADAEPVSEWGEKTVLVTGFVAPAAPLKPGRQAAFLGAMLGGLHSRPGTRGSLAPPLVHRRPARGDHRGRRAAR